MQGFSLEKAIPIVSCVKCNVKGMSSFLRYCGLIAERF